jgi:hypothetical protein
MQQLGLPYHHPTVAQILGVMQGMAEEEVAPQDEEWDCPPQTPRTPPHQMRNQDLGEESHWTLLEGEGIQDPKTKRTRLSDSFSPCLTG